MGARVPIDRIVDRVAPLALVGAGRRSTCPPSPSTTARSSPERSSVAWSGEHSDGHGFAGMARQRGAVAFICEHSLASEVDDALQLVVGPGMARPAMARAACAFYGDPATSMRTVGVTGTNGKTTTTSPAARRSSRRPAGRPGVIGTLGGERTTPEAPELQRLLAEMRDRTLVACAMEVTSHALVQHRVDGICFDVAVFTNLSQDHLDFHELDGGVLRRQGAALHARAGSLRGRQPRRRVRTAPARPQRNRRRSPTRSTTSATSRSGSPSRVSGSASAEVRLPMGGAFNVSNALAAASAARALGVESDAIVEGLASAERVPGRFEAMRERQRGDRGRRLRPHPGGPRRGARRGAPRP